MIQISKTNILPYKSKKRKMRQKICVNTKCMNNAKVYFSLLYLNQVLI